MICDCGTGMKRLLRVPHSLWRCSKCGSRKMLIDGVMHYYIQNRGFVSYEELDRNKEFVNDLFNPILLPLNILIILLALPSLISDYIGDKLRERNS